jgi:hypothetical protein
MSSGAQLTSHSQPLKSRYDLGAEHARDKERYAAREREDVIRKSKERKVAEVKARNLIKQQIADDRRARQSRGKPLLSPPATGTTGSLASVAGGGEEKAASASGAKSHASSSSTCRLQIRLPNGKVLRPLCRPVLLCQKWLSLSSPLTPASLLSPSYSHSLIISSHQRK